MQIVLQMPLPVDVHVDAIVEHARCERFAVVVAPPGSGKTTRIPPALTSIGRTILLQPRRVAARALARRIAQERGWTIGNEIGWQIRFERRFSSRTQLLVATEGILTARLQSDPLLSDFRVVVLDEFHERSIHADLALALVKEAAASRDDLAVIVMSATIDANAVSRYLNDARVFDIGAPRFPVDIQYKPGVSIADALRDAKGDALVFLPGAREIERARAELANIDALVLPLHGQLDVDAQERALAPAERRKVILATNVAETSLTVEGITDVVDTGQHKILRFDPETGIDHLVAERISLDSADQRAGRAGRTAPGRAIRLWDARDILRPHREPEIRRVDLASTVLDLIAWGGDPHSFDWFEAPPAQRLDAALDLLRQLGAIEGKKLTPIGEELRRYPLHPRLARLIIAANGDETAIAIAAAISEGVRSAHSDVFALADLAPREIVRELKRVRHRERERGAWPGGRRDAHDSGAAHSSRSLAHASNDTPLIRASRTFSRREKDLDEAGSRVRSLAEIPLPPGEGGPFGFAQGKLRPGEGTVISPSAPLSSRSHARDDTIRKAILAAYPDRVAQRREPKSERLLLASGTGAVEKTMLDAEFLVALEISGTLVRKASAIERDWLSPTHFDVVHTFANDRVKAVERAWYGAILLFERPAEVDPVEAQRLIDANRRIDPALQRRIAFAGSNANLDRLAPLSIPLPSGRSARLEYRDDGSVFAAVKLQELFGLTETPRIGPRQVPVTFELLAPNGRPVQVTRDLRSFWNGAYQEVRKQLRARYPRHPWPEDPWTAEATHRTRRK
jgi:ATP-dependent helicase HrpB